MRTYFIYDGQDQLGPFTLEELKRQKLSKQTLVWFEGLADWTTVENIPELAGLVNTPPPLPGQPFIQPPPIIENIAPYPINQQDSSGKWKPFVLTGATLAILIIVYLVYSNSRQSTALQHLQSEQQKMDIAIQTKESIEQKKEEERKKVNEAIAKKKKDFRNNWSSYVTVTNNKYRYSELGGIYGLYVMVYNNSDYMVEEIIATVTYIKANGGVWKTVEVPVYNIAAHSEKGVGVPDVGRGTSVIIGVNSMDSKEAQFCYTPGNWANRMEDPYFCK